MFGWLKRRRERKAAQARELALSAGKPPVLGPAGSARMRAEWALRHATCPCCSSPLAAGPCGGAAQNVVCARDMDCWRINTLPMGGVYFIIDVFEKDAEHAPTPQKAERTSTDIAKRVGHAAGHPEDHPAGACSADQAADQTTT